QEAYTKRWAQVFIVKGNEAAGKVGDETTFILAQQFADSGLPYIAQGGVGLYTTPVIFTAGAKGIILDTQLYLTPESPLPVKVKDFISKLDPTDTKIVGDSTNYKYRVYARLGTKIVKDYLQKEKDLISLPKEKRTIAFQKEIISERTMFDSQDILNSLLPMGQDVSFAKILTERFQTTQGIIDGLLAQTSKQLKSAVKNYPLRENVEIAQELGIKYPLIQGPMANVSESPAFALEIAKAGALPFLALGSLFKGQTRTLITKTQEVLGSQPFGCGIIGLEANYKARDEHLKQPFCIVLHQ
ncbi:MAG: nitronate monooxygenase, partial [Candidatus Heimdallarchaeota archaeon]